MPRGRPVGSAVRQNIVEILAVFGELHGYNVYRIYKKLFPEVTLRAVYYHLKKGVATGELEVSGIRKEAGEYSWGGEVERIYYRLGEQAVVKGDGKVKTYFAKQQAAR